MESMSIRTVLKANKNGLNQVGQFLGFEIKETNAQHKTFFTKP